MTGNVFNAAIRIPGNFGVVFHNLFVITFEVDIIAEQKQALLVTIFCFLKLIAFNSFHCTPVIPLFWRPWKKV